MLEARASLSEAVLICSNLFSRCSNSGLHKCKSGFNVFITTSAKRQLPKGSTPVFNLTNTENTVDFKRSQIRLYDTRAYGVFEMNQLKWIGIILLNSVNKIHPKRASLNRTNNEQYANTTLMPAGHTAHSRSTRGRFITTKLQSNAFKRGSNRLYFIKGAGSNRFYFWNSIFHYYHFVKVSEWVAEPA